MSNFENYLKVGFKPEDFKNHEFINSGSFGCVYKVLHQPSNIYYAQKIIELKPGKEQAFHMAEVLEEIKTLEKLSSYNPKSKAIPNFYGYYKESSFKGINFYLVLDYFPISLSNFDINHEQNPLQFLSNIFHSLLFGLAFLQTIGICHRDLKPGNIMLNEMKQPFLIDFGISENRDESQKNTQTMRTESTIKGTDKYMSPEQFLGLMNEEERVMLNPYKSDAFSFGLIILELGTKKKVDYYDLQMLEKSIAGNLAKFKTNFFQFLSTENDKKFFLKIYG